jgi:hypothetical protein
VSGNAESSGQLLKIMPCRPTADNRQCSIDTLRAHTGERPNCKGTPFK